MTPSRTDEKKEFIKYKNQTQEETVKFESLEAKDLMDSADPDVLRDVSEDNKVYYLSLKARTLKDMDEEEIQKLEKLYGAKIIRPIN